MTRPTNGDKDNDKSIFVAAMKGVEPLELSNKVIFAPKLPQSRKKKRLFIHDETQDLDYSSESSRVSAFEYLLHHQKGIRLQELTKLKKGDFTTQWRLDLHGKTSEQADTQIQKFIYQAWSNKARYAIIIHGKGYNSEDNVPTLKNLVNQRLKQLKQVLGFCSALPKDGGTGAVYVFLKSH